MRALPGPRVGAATGLPYSVPSARASWSGARSGISSPFSVRVRTVALRARHLDAVLVEGREQAPAEVAGGGPLVGGPDGAEDLERDAGLGERLDALDPRRLEDPPLPDRVAGHPRADLVDDRDRPVDVGAVGDRHVLVDPRPDAGQVRGHLDLAVRDGVDDAVEVAQRRPPQA